MTDDDKANVARLQAARVPRDAGASFMATRQGGLAMVVALNQAARAWIESYIDEEASWNGAALLLEMRYFPQFVDAAIEDGLTFERDPFPN